MSIVMQHSFSLNRGCFLLQWPDSNIHRHKFWSTHAFSMPYCWYWLQYPLAIPPHIYVTSRHFSIFNSIKCNVCVKLVCFNFILSINSIWFTAQSVKNYPMVVDHNIISIIKNKINKTGNLLCKYLLIHNISTTQRTGQIGNALINAINKGWGKPCIWWYYRCLEG